MAVMGPEAARSPAISNLEELLAEGRWPWRLQISNNPALAGLRGAYVSPHMPGGERVLLNGNWLASVDASAIEAVLLEEAGHAIEQLLLGGSDTPGDEGERFSALLRGLPPAASSTQENDHQLLQLEGQTLLVEAASLPIWTRLWGTTQDDLGMAMTRSSDGHLVVAGASATDPTAYSFGFRRFSGGYQGFTRKLALDGTTSWAITQTDTGPIEPDVQSRSVAATADGGVVVVGSTTVNGSNNRSGFVSRYDASGNLLWRQVLAALGGEETLLNACAVASDGTIAVTGRTQGNVEGLRAGGMDIVVARYAADGTRLWARQYGTASSEDALALTLGADGSITIGGWTAGALDGQTLTWPQTLPPNTASPIAPHDAFISRFTPDGNRLWTRLFSASSHNSVTALATGSDGAIHTAVRSTDGSLLTASGSLAWYGAGSGFLQRFLNDGTTVWRRSIGPTNASQTSPLALTVGSDGFLYVAGETTASTYDGQASSGGTDAFVTQFDSGGNRLWSSLVGSNGQDRGRAVTYADGFVYLAGDSTGALSGQLNTGAADAFLVKLDAGTSSTMGPGVSKISVSGNLITLELNRVLKSTVPALARFSAQVNGVTVVIQGVTVNPAARQVVLQLASAILATDNVTLAYTDSTPFDDTSGVVEDAVGLDLATFAATAVTNFSDATPPLVTEMEVISNSLRLFFNEPIAATVPAQARFTLSVEGFETPVLSVQRGAFNTVDLQLATPVQAGEMVLLAYADLSSANDSAGIAEDLAGNDLASFNARPVINRTSPVVPLALLSSSVQAESLTLQFNQKLGSALASPARFDVRVNGLTRTVVSVSLSSGSSMILELGKPVQAGDSVTLAYTDLSTANDISDVIEDLAGTDLPSFTAIPVANRTSPVQPLEVQDLAVNGAVLTITCNKPLAETLPALVRFAVTVNGVPRSVIAVITDPLAGRVSLTLASAVGASDNLTLTYSDLSAANDPASVIEDATGNDLASFTNMPVGNRTPVQPGPELSSLRVSGSQLTLVFTEPVTATALDLSRFSAKVNGTARAILAAAVNIDGSVSLTLATAVTSAQEVSLSYTDASAANDSSGVIENRAGLDLASFSNRLADTYLSATSVSSLNAAYRQLILTGSAAIQGVGNSGQNTLIGNTGANTLNGLGGDDRLDGGAGNDVLIGGPGVNILFGGIGTDTASYVGSAAAVLVSLANSDPQNTGGAGVDTLIGIENLTGSAFADVLVGNSGANVINGGPGMDEMAGGAGNDTYVVDNINDQVVEFFNSGNDLVQASVSYTLPNNGVERLTLTGTAALIGTGNSLSNVITGNAGNNRLYGMAGNDTLLGGSGNDTLIGGSGNDRLDGGAGIDMASYSTSSAAVTLSLALTTAQNTPAEGSDTLVGIEQLQGSAFDDLLTGNAGANTLMGGGGNDTLTGGNGSDRLLGGSGSDSYRYTTLGESVLNSLDTIADLVIGIDTIDAPTAVDANAVAELGSVQALDLATLSGLLSAITFPAFGAASFTLTVTGSPTRTFLALNDGLAGYSSTDGLIDITGYIGNLTALAVI